MATFGDIFSTELISFKSNGFDQNTGTNDYFVSVYNSSSHRFTADENQEIELIKFFTAQNGCVADLVMYVMYEMDDANNYYDRITERYYLQKYNQANYPFAGMWNELPDTPEDYQYGGVNYGNHADVEKKIFFSKTVQSGNYGSALFDVSEASMWEASDNDRYIFRGPCELFFMHQVQNANETGEGFAWKVDLIRKTYPGG